MEPESIMAYQIAGVSIKLWIAEDSYVVTHIRLTEDEKPLFGKSLLCLNQEHALTIFDWCVNSERGISV